MDEKKIRVGLVVDTYLPTQGGAEMHVRNLAKFLALKCHVKIFTNTPGDAKIDGIEVVRSSHKMNKIKAFLNDLLGLYDFIKSCDIIHAHYTYYLSTISVIMGKILNKPVMVTLHGLGTLDSSVERSVLKKIYRFVSFKLATAIFATSNEMAEVASRFVKKEKIFLVTNAVDTQYFKPTAKKESGKTIILSVRRLAPKNGVQYLVEAVPYILNHNSNVEFWITCQDKLEDYIKERVKVLDIGHKIKFLGEIPNHDLLTYYSQADIVVFPSSAESTSIACLEAMSMQKAVVASALSAYKDLLGNEERGLLVKLFDRESSDYNAPMHLPEVKINLLGEKILKLINDKQLCLDLGVAARKYVEENYDWRFVVDKIFKIYISKIN